MHEVVYLVLGKTGAGLQAYADVKGGDPAEDVEPAAWPSSSLLPRQDEQRRNEDSGEDLRHAVESVACSGPRTRTAAWRRGARRRQATRGCARRAGVRLRGRRMAGALAAGAPRRVTACIASISRARPQAG